MKAMILAAGHGMRMRPLTLTTPKALIEVHGQPMIFYHLQALQKIGVSDVVINVHHLPDEIINALGPGERFGLNLHFSREEGDILDTGGGVAKALPLLGSEPFILISSDVFTDYPFEKLPTQLKGLAHCVMVNNPEYHPHGDFHLNAQGLLTQEDLPKLTYGNIALVDPQLFSGKREKVFALRDVLRPAVAQSKVSGEHYQGFWQNIGTMQQLADLNQSTQTG